MSEYAFGTHFPPVQTMAPEYVDVEVFDGVAWFSLNDHYNFILSSRSLESSAQGRRNHTVQSEMFDGEFVVHSTLSNVMETIEVYVMGADQMMVGDNIERLVAAFSQSMYNVRRTFGQDVETWRCWPAEYQIQRGHVNIHNRRATVTFNVPRFPKVSREVME